MKILKAFTLIELAVFLAVVGTGGAMAFKIMSKKPTVKCVAREDDVLSGIVPFETWCQPITRKRLREEGLVDIGVCFPDLKPCWRICGTNPPPANYVADSSEVLFVTDERDVPDGEEYVGTDIWSSTDLLNWSYFGELQISDDGDWMESCWLEPTNTMRFFRVVKVYDAPAQ